MIIDLIYTLVLLIGFLLLGLPFVRMILGDLDGIRVFIATLAGFTLAVVCSSWLVALGMDLKWDLPLLALVSAVGFLVMHVRGERVAFSRAIPLVKSSRDFLLYAVPIMASGLSYILLQNSQIFRGQIAIRIGPDLIGWMSGAKFLCTHKNISILAKSIRDQIGIPDASLAFRSPLKFPATSIYQISSFTDQVNGEFLIGAHRLGLPGFEAGVCRLLGESSLYHASIALMAVSAILIAAVATIVIKDQSMKTQFKVIAIFLCAVNVNIVSVAMEGGFGQLAATPFLIFLLMCLLTTEWRTRFLPIACFLLVAFALATYVDAIFAFLAFASVYFVIQGGFKHLRRPKRLGIFFRVSISLFCALLVGWPLWNSLWRLILERVSSGGVVGGWGQNKVPYPTDFWGIFNWLPYDGVHNTQHGFVLKIIEVLISLFILYKAARSDRNIFKRITAASLILYLLLMFIIYKDGVFHSNNYQLWKLSGYLSTLMILALASISDYQKNPISRNQAARSSIRGNSWWVSTALVFALLSSYGWSSDWLKSRQFMSPTGGQAQRVFFEKYDVQAVGFINKAITKFILMGDVHYFEPIRSYNVLVKRSSPPRTLVYLVPNTSCQTFRCITDFGVPALYKIRRHESGTNEILNGNFRGWKSEARSINSSDFAENWIWDIGTAGSVSRRAFTQVSNPTSQKKIKYFASWNISSNSKNKQVFQKIPNVSTLSGQRTILTFWARKPFGSTTFTARLLQDFGTGGSPSKIYSAYGFGSLKLTSTWHKYTQVWDIPSISDQTLGLNRDSSLWVSIQATNTAIGGIDLADIQLRSVATLIPIPRIKMFSSSEFNAYE